MLNHYFILCRWALFTKEHYALAYYKNKWISLCFLKDPWKSIGALLLFCCGGVHLKMQIRADQSEALKPEPCQPIRSSKTWATLSAVIPSYTEPPITSYFSDWSSFLYNLFGTHLQCPFQQLGIDKWYEVLNAHQTAIETGVRLVCQTKQKKEIAVFNVKDSRDWRAIPPSAALAITVNLT